MLVTTPSGVSGTKAGDEFTYGTGLPAITSVSPALLNSAGGDTVTITGSGFAGATGVRIDASSTCTEGVASFTVNNDTSITAVTAFPDECFVNYPGFDFRVITPSGISPISSGDAASFNF